MKASPLSLSVFLIMFLFNFSICRAEKIFYKDGKVLNAEILDRDKGSIRCKSDLGSISINARDIDKIENNDGSISKYDYASMSGAMIELISGRKYAEAEKLCATLMKSFPDSNQVRYLRGLLNQKMGNFDQALEDYNFLIKQGYANAEIINNLGAIYAHKKDPQKAQEFFLEAIKFNPDMAEAHNNLAHLLLKTKDYQAAAEEYNKVLEKEPDNAQVLYSLGVCYINSKDYLKAKEAWQKVLDLKPDDQEARDALERLKLIE